MRFKNHTDISVHESFLCSVLSLQNGDFTRTIQEHLGSKVTKIGKLYEKIHGVIV